MFSVIILSKVIWTRHICSLIIQMIDCLTVNMQLRRRYWIYIDNNFICGTTILRSHSRKTKKTTLYPWNTAKKPFQTITLFIAASQVANVPNIHSIFLSNINEKPNSAAPSIARQYRKLPNQPKPTLPSKWPINSGRVTLRMLIKIVTMVVWWLNLESVFRFG